MYYGFSVLWLHEDSGWSAGREWKEKLFTTGSVSLQTLFRNNIFRSLSFSPSSLVHSLLLLRDLVLHFIISDVNHKIIRKKLRRKDCVCASMMMQTGHPSKTGTPFFLSSNSLSRMEIHVSQFVFKRGIFFDGGIVTSLSLFLVILMVLPATSNFAYSFCALVFMHCVQCCSYTCSYPCLSNLSSCRSLCMNCFSFIVRFSCKTGREGEKERQKERCKRKEQESLKSPTTGRKGWKRRWQYTHKVTVRGMAT